MKNTKIEYIRQYDGQNYLIVKYKSGCIRYVYLGDSYYRFTKTQADFMNNAKRTITEFEDDFFQKSYYTTWIA